MGRTADYSRQSCSIAATLEVIGDPWTLLVVRDAFNGVTRFEQWQERLGVARNVLAARLKSLVQHGVLEPRLYSERPPRNEYVLTPKGKDLYGVLVTLHGWGAKHVYGETGAGVSMTHKACGQDLKPRIACGCCGEIVKPRDIQLTLTADCPTVGDVMPDDKAA
ncbi:MAG: helix-turn-helix transcriptional regulator [Alphaproteobacteria bacterium]|nr:helix-turn-helix transcriptional regulator [Alphaproteobacteria bacterium]MBU1525526.1 helix-turn-helix transcriptional regulator [Alphaproteobacteria bacterium]MBU2117142.1 helix-turn-helix transcriptional regulator [Alphaproteobacteria bacterium]MBU2350928.1 helix-turn-helix transcriptional regulator [Alphaproteobacteria bacterium]MBU2383095.1 helix-turn-helix transcriptional regulator [Alphaproteobacteria bacterium]